MTKHDPGPLDELGQNLTGSAAGRYDARIHGTYIDDVSETQGPHGRVAAPMARPGPEDDPDDDPVDTQPRPEDADGAPEL